MRYPLVLLGMAALGLSGSAQQPASETKPVTIEGQYDAAAWGKAEDLAGDCHFQFKEPKTLTIAVPGSKKPHDLAAEIHNTNAPRILQPVKGDFNVEVKVEGDFQPGEESSQQGRPGYTSAALVAMADADNYVTLARAGRQFAQEQVPTGFVNFEIRSDGNLVRFGSPEDRPVDSDKPLYLRLEKRGRQMLGYVSEDGKKWEPLVPKELPETWPETATVGVAAVSTSRAEFKPRFSDLKVEQGAALKESDK